LLSEENVRKRGEDCPMELEYLKKIIKVFEESEINELEVEDKVGRVKLSKAKAAEMITHVPAPMPAVAAAPAAAAPAAEPRSGFTIDSPMVGTFYEAPAPDAASFAKVGDRVSPDTIVCIVEAMKIMNEIKAETSGVVKEILVENGQPVEFGQAMFLIDVS
jgi:acetyl-CoA carboxylase biotin carboxyl carrier protein